MEKLAFLKVTVLSAFLTLLRVLTGFVISKVIAVYTGPSGMAALGQLQNFVGFINGIISNQVSQGVNRYTAENHEDLALQSSWWKATTLLIGITLGILIPCGILLSHKISLWLFSNEELYWIIIISIFVLPLNTANTILMAVLNAKGHYTKYFLINGLSVLTLLIVMWQSIVHWGLKGALVSAAINNAMAGLWAIIFVFKEYWFKWSLWVGACDRERLAGISKYFVMGIIGAATGPISLILVRQILTNELSLDSAGYWQSVWKISEAYLGVLTTALAIYYFPKTAAAKNKSDHLHILKVASAIILPLAISMACAVYIARYYIVSILFTKSFLPAIPLFAYQNIGDVIRIASWLFATIMLAKGYFKLSAVTEIVFCITFPVLTYLLTIQFGLIGVGMAYIINYSVYFFTVLIIYLYHIRRINNGI
ncbi:O-antigen translocase [Hafnia alvei]|uniref:O-antigen translocase n=1 Tax=Hafnia alvei TaxID=569 RepID=UPI0040444092